MQTFGRFLGVLGLRSLRTPSKDTVDGRLSAVPAFSWLVQIRRSPGALSVRSQRRCDPEVWHTSDSGMPILRCLDKTFELTHADLERVSGSVLAEAWSTSSGKTAVCLDTWPEPDLDVLKVHS